MRVLDSHGLHAMFHATDPPADEVAHAYHAAATSSASATSENGSPTAADQSGGHFFRAVLAARYAHPSDVEATIRSWTADGPALPEWATDERLDNGADFFAEWGIELGLGLFLSSLPLAYASKPGVQVLALTAQLETHAKRRVMESAQFVLDVTQKGALRPGARGYVDTRLVRLMHAGVRDLVRDEQRIPRTNDESVWPRWDPAWGEPINQQHLLGAMLSYSSSLLQVLDAFDIVYDEQAAEDYCLMWNVVGWLLGLDPSLLPMDRAEMDRLTIEIRGLNEAESEAGRMMTAALLEVVASMVKVPGLKGYPATLMRFLISDETADLLGVPPANWTRVLLTVGRAISRRLSLEAAHGRLTRAAMRRYSKLVLRGFVDVERDGDRPTFAIPATLPIRKRRSAG